MKSKYIIISFFLLFINLYSCNDPVDLQFKKNDKIFSDAAECILENYNFWFTDKDFKSSITVFYSKRLNDDICQDLFILLNKQKVDIITCDRDSTIWFFSESVGKFILRQKVIAYSPIGTIPLDTFSLGLKF